MPMGRSARGCGGYVRRGCGSCPVRRSCRTERFRSPDRASYPAAGYRRRILCGYPRAGRGVGRIVAAVESSSTLVSCRSTAGSSGARPRKAPAPHPGSSTRTGRSSAWPPRPPRADCVPHDRGYRRVGVVGVEGRLSGGAPLAHLEQGLEFGAGGGELLVGFVEHLGDRTPSRPAGQHPLFVAGGDSAVRV